MRKICIITGTRAEYGLLYWLMQLIKEDNQLELQIIATGMHLSPEFGLTYQEIEKDFKIDRKIEILLSNDSPIAISKSMGLALISFAEAYDMLSPDIIVVLGDRFEIFSATSAAITAKIPIAHLHGGESTQGAIDEAMRHAITKMSHIHFTATEPYRNRVIQLGEQPNHVYNVGGLGIDNIKNLPLLSKKAFEESIAFNLSLNNILVTYHPVTLENHTANRQFSALLKVIDQLQDTHIIFTKANADTDGHVINQMIDDYVSANKEKSIAFTSLGQLRYLSALQYMDAVVGNSSSGLLEAPSFNIATINIGDRQTGRIKADSVIDCQANESAIQQAFKLLYTPSFQQKLSTIKNPYGNGGASHKIKETLKNINLNNLIKKPFYDLEFNL